MPSVVDPVGLNLVVVALLLSIGWTLGSVIINAIFNFLLSGRQK